MIIIVLQKHFIWNYYGRPLTTLYLKLLWSSADNTLIKIDNTVLKIIVVVLWQHLLKIIMVVRWQHFT